VGGFGCGLAKLNVVFLFWQVRWQNTSFGFLALACVSSKTKFAKICVWLSFYYEAQLTYMRHKAT